MTSTIPRIISFDDHIVEPPNLWWDRLPAADRERGPHVVRKHGRLAVTDIGKVEFVEDDDDGSRWCDIWIYDDMVWPFHVGYANVGPAREQKRNSFDLMTYDEMLPGCYEQSARLADMTLDHVEASLCFPTVPRFCGQAFNERKDKDFALTCLKVYNDWIIDEWCGGAAVGRLIPLTVIPLWDPVLAAAEVRRCAEKGSHAIAFSEAPHALGLPSIHSGAWEPLFAACTETETVINMHIGSSSKMPNTSADAPVSVAVSLTFENSMHAVTDWLLSGALARHEGLKIALSEGQVGWMPFLLNRIDGIWERSHMYEAGLRERVPERPSSYVPGRVYGCIFDDVPGLQFRDSVGMSQIMFETDYPHADSAFPSSAAVAEKLMGAAGLNERERWQFLRGNAIECYQLQRYGIVE